jgi:hypothetical protein
VSAVKEAERNLINRFHAYFDGSGLPESCSEINEASRAVVDAMLQENGEAWLCIVNVYEDTPRCFDGKPVVLWKHTGDRIVRNFSASFVLPAYDADLERLILERHESTYTGTADDLERIEAIHAAAEKAGGIRLVWT